MKNYLILAFCLFGLTANAQVKVEGYTFESGNRGYLRSVYVRIVDTETRDLLGETYTNEEGYFVMENIPFRKSVNVFAKRPNYKVSDLKLNMPKNEKMFVKIEMRKSPGYQFEVTLAEKKDASGMPTDAIRNSRIEIWNNTTRKEELALIDHPDPVFDFHFKKGNHYTILIRKPGYLSKRMEAFIDVKGCILCFEGVGAVTPGVADNLTEGNAMGVLLANVELEKIFEGKSLEIENIYYDLGKWNIASKAREQLKKVILLMKDNPNLKIELGSHTDSRGKSEFNRKLSEKRAQAAVQYITQRGDVDPSRISSRGYGETRILNKCVDGIQCTEAEHSVNRRTELKILGIDDIHNYKSLKQMKLEELYENGEIESEIIRVKDGESLEQALNGNGDTTTKIETQEPTIENSPQESPVKEVIKETEVNTDTIVETVEQTENVVEQKIAPPVSTAAAPPRINGYKIVVHKSKSPISANHKVSKRHDKLELYIADDEILWYMIGGFQSEDEAKKALHFLTNAYPDAYIASFKNGVLQ